MTEDDAWFAPKRFGYGASWPVRWQGWALIVGFAVAALLLRIVLADRQPLLFVASLVLASIPVLIMSARHTRGGWHWRWGGDE